MPLNYSQVGDDYDRKDPVKKYAQMAALETGANLLQHNMREVKDSRGESAYVWKQGNIYMAAAIEGLGTKNMVADAMRQITGKTYYDIIGYETVATIINDLITIGAKPLVTHAYWAVGSNDWLQDEERLKDLVSGWKEACMDAGCSWGGGETPTLQNIVSPDYIDLGGSSVGIITHEKRLITDEKLSAGDKIILLRSTGLNANGISLARAVAEKMPQGYATRLPNGQMFGEAVLNKTNIYAKLLQNIFDNGVDLHYVSNITGHGLRKIMRAKGKFTYVIQNMYEPPEVCKAVQKYAELSDEEMYGTYNMGMDFALFVSPKDVYKTLETIKMFGFEAKDAGYIEKGQRQVVLQPKNITFGAETLDLR